MHATDKLVILVVEDSHTDIQLLKHQLKGLDQVITKIATTLEEAKDLLKFDRYDYVFLDGNLNPATKREPEPDTLGLLKSIAPYYGCRIYTTSDNVGYQEKMITAGCTAHINKGEIADFLMKKLEVRGLLPTTKDSYLLHKGSLLVVRLVEPERDKGTPFLAYIAEIKETNPLILKVADHGPFSSLEAHQYLILEAESQLIQDNPEQREELLKHYMRMQPLRSGLAQFGGTMCDVLPTNQLQEA